MSILDQDVAEVLITAEKIRERIAVMGATIANDYAGQDLLLVCVLRGAVVFLSDLMRSIPIPHSVDFMAISSYGASTESTGVVRILKDLDTNIERRNVLIVEDIIDTGRTLDYMLQNLRTRRPKSLRTCTLLSKPSRRQMHVPLDYVGFEVPDKFVVGYGLDFAELYRNLPYIGVLRKEKYQSSH
jgi:hypoxanthine phosphoribosyltransferase